MLKLLSDRRTPTCPHCGMAKLEPIEVTESWERNNDDGKAQLVEQTFGRCPNCNHTFEYLQIFTHDPVYYEAIEDTTDEDELEEEEDE